jgi:hypothetical protein
MEDALAEGLRAIFPALMLFSSALEERDFTPRRDFGAELSLNGKLGLGIGRAIEEMNEIQNHSFRGLWPRGESSWL